MHVQNEQQPLHTASLGKRALQGAGIALVLIVIFLLKAGEHDPDWHKLWMIRPLVVVPVAGAMGGVFYYFMDHLRYQGGWRKLLANILSLVVYIIGLWLGTVLGLDGTMWN
ncbi:MAG: potassium transporter KefB [Flavisolibacter sp.]|nr:potassium transporter KefB [Flavisolibacter sp.]